MSIDYRQLSSQLIQENNMLGDRVSTLSNELSSISQELNDLYMLVETTPNNMELGKRVRTYYFDNTEEMPEEPTPELFVYESPDNGKTLYKRKVGEYADKKLVNDTPKQMELF